MNNQTEPIDNAGDNSQAIMSAGETHLPSTRVYETMPPVEEEINLRDYLDVILRRRWVIILTLLVTFSLVAVFTFSSTPLFLAQGTLKASPRVASITNFKGIAQGMDESFMQSKEFIATQVKLLQNEGLLIKLIKKMDLQDNVLFVGKKDNDTGHGILGGVKEAFASLKNMIRPRLDSDPANKMNRKVQKNITLENNLGKIKNSLTITPVRGTQLIKISFQNPHSGLAADIVNNLMKEFLQVNAEQKLAAFHSSGVFLDKQVTASKIKLEKSEQELNGYARRTGIISLNSKLNLVMGQLEAVNDALAQAVTARISKESLYLQTKKNGGENLPQVLNNPLLQNLKKQYSDLRSQYEVLSTVFKDQYPKVKKLKAQMKDLRNRYAQEQQLILDSIRLAYEEALEKEKRLTTKAEAQKKLAIELNSRATQYKILRREVATNREVYSSLLSRSKEIEASAGSDNGNIMIVSMARPPLYPYKPKVARNLLLGIVLGSFAGVGLAFVLEYLDDTIKNPDEFPQRYHIPVLGLIPFKDAGKTDDEFDEIALTFYNEPKAPLSEAIRTAMVAINLSTAATPPKTVLITSVLPDAGKSTLASNLSLSLLASSAKVLLIDTDLRKPGLHKIFGQKDNSIGLSSFLAGTADIDEVIMKTEFPNLFFIPSGPIPPSPAELLASSTMRAFIAAAAREYDYLILDAPPFHGFAEILILSNMVDGVILTTQLNRTPRDGVEYFRKAVTNVGGRILGTLVNKVPTGKTGSRYYGGYKYYKYYSYDYEYGRDA